MIHIFVLTRPRYKDEVGAVKMLKPFSNFTDLSKEVLLLWNLYDIFVSCLSCCLVCSLQHCGADGSLVCCVFLCFVKFPYGVLGQVWVVI